MRELTVSEQWADFNAHESRVQMVKVDLGRVWTRRLVRLLQKMRIIART